MSYRCMRSTNNY